MPRMQKLWRADRENLDDWPYEVQIPWDSLERHSESVHRWTVEMKLENHRDYIVFNVSGAKAFRFKDANQAMLFKLAWV